MNKFARFFSAIALLALFGTLSACKKTFDEPPGPADPNIVANMTIEGLKALHTIPGAYDEITQDIVISGIVVANDKSGNFYKQLFIQDSTGAIQLLVNANSLYTSFPVGRKVFVKTKGLTLSDDNGNMILGYKAIVSGIPSLEGINGTLVGQHLIGGSIGHPVVPIEVTYSQLTTSMQSRYINALVKLSGYEFIESDTSRTYSDTSVYKRTTNLNIKSCSGGPNVIVRTSAYANFAGLKVPPGNGDITAIFTVFGSTRQLVIRDTSDVQFYGLRCGQTPPPAGTLVFENFESQTVPSSGFNPITIAGWVNMSELGNRTFSAKQFNSNKYAELSAFGSNAAVVRTWLVTKAIDLNGTTNERLSFETKQGFIGSGGITSAALKVLVSTTYTGTGNPWDATWTDITSQATLSPGTETSFPSSFTPSGNVDLSSYSGTIYVAFRYEGADPTGSGSDLTSTWQIDNISVVGD